MSTACAIKWSFIWITPSPEDGRARSSWAPPKSRLAPHYEPSHFCPSLFWHVNKTTFCRFLAPSPSPRWYDYTLFCGSYSDLCALCTPNYPEDRRRRRRRRFHPVWLAERRQKKTRERASKKFNNLTPLFYYLCHFNSANNCHLLTTL